MATKKPRKPIKVPVLKPRNDFALHAKLRKAGPMKDRREGRGGIKNEQRDLLSEDE